MTHYHLVRTENTPKRVYSSYSVARDYSQVPGPLTGDYARTQTSIEFADSRPIYRVPARKYLIASGAQAATPYTRVGEYVTQDGGYAVVNWLANHGYGLGVATETFSGVPYLQKLSNHFGTSIKADNQALIRFYAAIKTEQEHMNALVSIGELRETVRMLRRPFSGVQKVCDSYLDKVRTRTGRLRWRRRKPLSHGEQQDLIADAWLETSFGLRPFLADTAAIAETFAALAYRTRRSSVQGYGEDELVLDRQYWDYEIVPGTFLAFSTIGDRKTSWKVKYRAGLNAQWGWPDGSWNRLGELSGFVPENFVPTAYELLPWSFLADYFFNVGQCLSSYYTSTAAVTWAIASEKIESTRSYRHVFNLERTKANVGSTFVSAGGHSLGKSEAKYLQFSRTILDVASLPAPLVDSRKLTEISPLQAGNMLALLKSKARGVRAAILTASRG